MSKALAKLVEDYSDLLIQVLELRNPGDMLRNVLINIDETETYIEKGLLR